jgi:hypothetical protein
MKSILDWRSIAKMSFLGKIRRLFGSRQCAESAIASENNVWQALVKSIQSPVLDFILTGDCDDFRKAALV